MGEKGCKQTHERTKTRRFRPLFPALPRRKKGRPFAAGAVFSCLCLISGAHGAHKAKSHTLNPGGEHPVLYYTTQMGKSIHKLFAPLRRQGTLYATLYIMCVRHRRAHPAPAQGTRPKRGFLFGQKSSILFSAVRAAPGERSRDHGGDQTGPVPAFQG